MTDLNDSTDLYAPGGRPNMGLAALAYATSGWYVVPLHTVRDGSCSCQRRGDCPRPGKHPVGFLVRRGSKAASAYPLQVERWWARMPEANIGVVLGPSGLVVLDVDPRNGGLEALQRLQDRRGPLPETLTAITGGEGGDGRHFIFADPDGAVIGSKGHAAQEPLDGLEILARGNLIVASPSLHRSGRRYSWLNPHAVPVTIPGWMTEGLR